MNTNILSKGFFIFCCTWPIFCFAADPIYSNLQMLNYDEMLAKVKVHVKSAEKVKEATQAQDQLEEAMRLILARPNNDNMVSQLFPIVRSPLRNMDSYDIVLDQIIDDAISVLRSPSTKPPQQITNLFIIGNLLGELKPDLQSNEKVKAIFVKIRDAKLEFSQAAQKELRSRGSPVRPGNPSEMAAKALSTLK